MKTKELIRQLVREVFQVTDEHLTEKTEKLEELFELLSYKEVDENTEFPVDQPEPSGIEYVELNYEDNHTFNLTQEQLTKIQNGAFIKLIFDDGHGNKIFEGIAMPVSDTQYTTNVMIHKKGIFCTYIDFDFENMTYYTYFVKLQEVPSNN